MSGIEQRDRMAGLFVENEAGLKRRSQQMANVPRAGQQIRW